MGNSLCKEPRSGSSMRPGRVLDSFGSIVCPNGLGKHKHGMNKTYLSRHVLETSSKPNTLGSWNNAPLASPDSSKVIDTPPVAPPRKKRATLERGTSPEIAMKVRNGFKDVFGPDSRRQSCDVVAKSKPVDTVDKSVPLKTQSSFEIDLKDDEFSDFSKVPTKTELEPTAAKVDPESNGAAAKGLRVGNRKSDKFFGENLSDALSDDPVVIERRKSAKKGMADLDKIDQFIEKNVLNMSAQPESKPVPEIKITEPEVKIGTDKGKPAEQKDEKLQGPSDDESIKEEDLLKYIDESMIKETSLGKKAEFLMAMLEDYPDDRYTGMVPVEEPIIVPRKRKSRHICDDDEHMHNMLHKHDSEVTSSKNLITTEASIETPPPKPNRDFSKYLAPTGDGNDTDDSISSGPVRRWSARKASPAPVNATDIPKIPSDAEFQQHVAAETITSTPKKLDAPAETKAHSPRTLKRIISMPTSLVKTESRSPSPRPPFMKSSSSSSFLVMDLQQAHKIMVPFTPEDPLHNAPDELVKPKSRLVTRKISTKSSDGFPCTPTPTLEIPAPKFTIGSGSSECLSNPPGMDPPPPPIPKRRRSSTGDNKRSPPRDLLGYDLGGFLVSSHVLPHHDITHVVNSIYNEKNNDILEEFQVYLEEQINTELNNPDTKNPNTTKLLEILSKQSNPDDRLEDINIELVDLDHSNKSSDIDDCFDPEFEKIEKTEIDEATKQQGSAENVDNWFENNSDAGSVIEGSDKLGNMVTVKSGAGRTGRRESIEDVDNWFQNHIQSSLLDEQIIGLRKQRRGSDGFLAYDTSRQYPFGAVRNRQRSESADLFEDITKLHDLGSKEDAKTNTQLSTVKSDRLRERRGSDGLVFYDTSRKFPFGEPNENLPKAIEKSKMDEENSANHKNEPSESTLSKANVEKHTAQEQSPGGGSSDHSTLLKFLSKEKLIE